MRGIEGNRVATPRGMMTGSDAGRQGHGVIRNRRDQTRFARLDGNEGVGCRIWPSRIA